MGRCGIFLINCQPRPKSAIQNYPFTCTKKTEIPKNFKSYQHFTFQLKYWLCIYYIRISKNKIVFKMCTVSDPLNIATNTSLFLQYMSRITHSQQTNHVIHCEQIPWICEILLSRWWMQMSVEVWSDSDNGLRVAAISVMTALGAAAGPRNLCHRLLGTNKTWATSNK